jgi:hypothetical protein
VRKLKQGKKIVLFPSNTLSTGSLARCGVPAFHGEPNVSRSLHITTATSTCQDKSCQRDCCIISIPFFFDLRTIDFGNPALAIHVSPPATNDGSRSLWGVLGDLNWAWMLLYCAKSLCQYVEYGSNKLKRSRCPKAEPCC